MASNLRAMADGLLRLESQHATVFHRAWFKSVIGGGRGSSNRFKGVMMIMRP